MKTITKKKQNKKAITKKGTVSNLMPKIAPKKDISSVRFLVTGGSGSLGLHIIKELLSRGAKNIISISRHEKLIKQAEFEVDSPYVKFKLGDITDRQFVTHLMKEVDVVFNTAAIKHVTLAENNPREAHRVNIGGLMNLLDASSSIKRFIHISSDKAIGVVNCYGATKLLGEYMVRESNDLYRNNTYLIMRAPNFLGSRGSVVDLWKDQLRKNNTIEIRDPEMTRYFVSLPDAAKFVVDVALSDKPNVKEPYYPVEYTKKFKLKDIAEVFIKLHGNKDSKLKITGAMPGEKRHEDYIKDVPLAPATELVGILRKLI